MDLLRHIFESLGFSHVVTFIASGNVIFETGAGDIRMLEKKIERKLQSALGHHVSVFIRSPAELRDIAAFEPFAVSQMQGGAGVNIIFLGKALDERTRQSVLALHGATDEFQVHGREIYWLRRRKPGKALFSTVPLEKTISEPFTIRGADTVRKLVAKYLS